MRRLVASGHQFFDSVHLFRPADLSPQFRAENELALRSVRGYGFWCWKPYVILKALTRTQPGDFVLYLDSQAIFVSDPSPLFDQCAGRGGVLLFHQRKCGHKNFTWTKRDAFVLMHADFKKYTHGDNLVAGTQLYQHTTKAIEFLAEMLHWCANHQVISDEDNVTGKNYPGFRDHRHDQSILSILAIRYQIDPVNDITEWGRGYAPQDRAGGQIVELDRKVICDYANPWRDGRPQRTVGAGPVGTGVPAMA